MVKTKDYIALFAAIAISESAGLIGSASSIQSIPIWYTTLTKPPLNPPGWVFGPVWTLLYAIMGIAAFMVWRKGTQHRAVKNALTVFGLQLVLNALWSVIFFGFRSPAAALIEIIALWIAIVWTIILFYKISRPAAWLLLPYILWVSFAVYLTAAVWYLN
ncbi:MAG: TspO/MBR family protein [Patescibacteria group bacterium]|jgi:tryptophan-rich sensory protein